MWTTLNFKGRSKTKIMARNICNRIIYIEFERDWWVGLGLALGDEKKNLKNIFPVSGIFPGKPRVSYCWASNIDYYKPRKFNQNR